ncbi:MAG: hypothetical protein ACFFD4_05225 [Candidatus Odinarchaeota archaeon]
MSYNRNFESETHDVKISDVKPLEKNMNVVFKVIERGEVRKITKRDSYDSNRVCDFTVADDSGKIVLTLWNDDIDSTEVNSTYKLSNGFTNVFRSSLRLSKGKQGSLKRVQTDFKEINVQNDRSAEKHDDPRRNDREQRSGFGRTSSRPSSDRRGRTSSSPNNGRRGRTSSSPNNERKKRKGWYSTERRARDLR